MNEEPKTSKTSRAETTRCTCLAGSTYGTDDPTIRRCDLCDGIVLTDPVTGEYEDAKPPKAESETPWRVDDLVALINQMAYRLRKADPANPWPDKAAEYLRRKGLVSSPLREGATHE